ncbi:MAG: hypothetical protein JWO67_7394 [Streptosporangiaceae bacterium]|nr:hypothetical protein [Streptosporangiaceae bacterium]
MVSVFHRWNTHGKVRAPASTATALTSRYV